MGRGLRFGIVPEVAQGFARFCHRLMRRIGCGEFRAKGLYESKTRFKTQCLVSLTLERLCSTIPLIAKL